MLKLGIGVVTYNRAETVLRTLDLILQHTRRQREHGMYFVARRNF